MDKGIVLGTLGKDMDHIKIFDKRFQGPYVSNEGDNQKVVFQKIDKLRIADESIGIFRVNYVSINMDISEQYYKKAKVLYKDFMNYKLATSNQDVNEIKFMIEKSKKMCDYIAAVQQAVIFSYTSVESFINLSIPQTYIFEENQKEGVKKVYDVNGIQRYIDLKNKIKKIICKIYKLDNITKQKFWPNFCILEEIRNSIIHLKNTSYDEMMEKYLDTNIFMYINASNELINYIITETENRKHKILKNELLWPKIYNENKGVTIYGTSFPCLQLDK